MAEADLMASLREAGVNRGDLVALVVTPALGYGLAAAGRTWAVPGVAAEVGRADEALRPRWVTWSGQAAARLAADGVRLATGWDIAAAHRLLFGGWRADPGWAWARIRRLDTDAMPASGPPDLFGMDEGDGTDPVAPDGHLRPAWTGGGWADRPDRIARWAGLALTTAELQREALSGLEDRPMALPTVRAESTAELLCAELSADGLPMDRAVAERVLTSLIGPRPRSEAEAASLRAARDAEVLR
ncbi:MAG TPA: hypothetical protein VGH88_08310, partial [Streptosporangiaceae bacterium]